jgi:hypothetical protein
MPQVGLRAGKIVVGAGNGGGAQGIPAQGGGQQQQMQQQQQQQQQQQPQQQQQMPHLSVGVPFMPSVTVGRHQNNAVQKGNVVDATTRAPASTENISLPVSGAASCIMMPVEYQWMTDVESSSPSAMLYFNAALKGQQCPRSGLLHMLFLLSDRAAERSDPEGVGAIITNIALNGRSKRETVRDPWCESLPSTSMGLFAVRKVADIARPTAAPLSAEGGAAGGGSNGERSHSPGGSSTHSNAEALMQQPRRPGMRPMLVDGELFMSNVLRELHEEDPRWFLVAECPDMVRGVCSDAVTRIFTNNGVDPRFIFSGVPGAECDSDPMPCSTTVLRHQDNAWDMIKANAVADAADALLRYQGGGGNISEAGAGPATTDGNMTPSTTPGASVKASSTAALTSTAAASIHGTRARNRRRCSPSDHSPRCAVTTRLSTLPFARASHCPTSCTSPSAMPSATRSRRT